MKICVGISGSIAAYRSVDFVRELIAHGHEVQCILTQAGAQFVSEKALETFTQRKVHLWDSFRDHFATEHISAARWADAFILYGATSNLLAKLRYGLGDDFLCLQLLAFEGPVFVAPAMNPSMWSHAATQDNFSVLQKRGYEFVGPVGGKVACGESGIGHLAPHEEIIHTLHSKLALTLPLAKKRILISAGPMRTQMDSVRFLQNQSSGRMGLEIAKACKKLGAEVSLLLGPVDSQIASESLAFHTQRYLGASDYGQLLQNTFPNCDIFFSAAAVLDFDLQSLQHKMSRQELSVKSKIELDYKPVQDWVALVSSQKKSHQRVFAFAAESGTENEIIERAKKKLTEKKVDAILANPVWPNLGPEAKDNIFWIIQQNGELKKLGPDAKSALAPELIKYLLLR